MAIIETNVTQNDFIRAYLLIWNGNVGLTPKEIDVLVEFLKHYLQVEKDGVPEPYLSREVFSTDRMKEVRDILSLTEPGLNNYKTQLRDKGVLHGEGRNIQIDPKLIPRKEITFKFIVNEERTN